MLKIFRTQIAIFPVTIIVLLMVFMRITVLMQGYFENHWLENLAPFSYAFKALSGNLLTQNIWFNIILSGLLVFFQSGIIVSILNYFRVEELKGFLAAWLYVLVLHIFPAYVFLSPQLIAVTFILLAFRSILFIDESKHKLKPVFNSGLYIGLATVFWYPSILFIPLIFAALIKFNFFSLRIFLSFLISFSLPFIYSVAYLFIMNKPLSLISKMQINQLKFNFYDIKDLLSFSIICLILLTSTPLVIRFLDKLLKKPKEFFQLVFVYIFCFFILVFFQNENNINLLIVLGFPVAMFLSIYFNRIKRNFLAESIHLVLLLSIVVNFIYFLR